MSKEKKERTHYPFPDAPFADPVFGQPESCADLVNKYGTYNIQPTADTGNVFPLISHALPEQWKDMAIGKDELEQELNYLKTTRSDEVAEQIKIARGFGDISENSEYDEAKNEQGKLYSYQANYSKFLEMKAEREELIAAGERKRQNFLRTELEWVRRGAQARSTKQKARLQRFEEVSAIRAPEEKQSVELSSVGSRLGKKTIALRNICKAYDGKTYIKDFSYIILRDDRVGIIGDNGCGKSTLLNIMTGRLKPDSGEVEIGETVKIGVFAQENVDMDEKQRVIDYIRDEAEIIRTADGHITASQMLDRFLFPPSMQRGPISVLSGGERRRLYLCRVLMGAPNILFLDEPTNDLDIETLMILEEYLEHFNGAVVAVSHDRYFLDKTMGRIFAFLGNGRIKQYEGGYSDCKAAREKETPIFAEKAVKVKREEPQKEKAPIKKMSYKDQREYDTIGDEIAALEEKIAKTDADMAACATDFTHLQELSAEKEALEAKLEERMERWMELSELAEEIERNKA